MRRKHEVSAGMSGTFVFMGTNSTELVDFVNQNGSIRENQRYIAYNQALHQGSQAAYRTM
jgi:hypothetical protein